MADGQRHRELTSEYHQRMRTENLTRHVDSNSKPSLHDGRNSFGNKPVYSTGPDHEPSPFVEFYGDIGKYFVMAGPIHVLIAFGIHPILGVADCVATLGYTIGGVIVYFAKK